MIDEKLIVVKHNDLIHAAQRLSPTESKILLHCIAKINSKGSLEPTDMFTLHISDLESLSEEGIEINYGHLKDAVDRLSERWVHLLKPSKRSRKPDEEKIRWVSAISYKPYEGTVTLGFSFHIIPFLTELTKEFTQYKLQLVTQFKSMYSLRFYELLKSWSSSTRYISLEDLRAYLDLGDTHLRSDKFKENVLTPSMTEINKFTDMTVSYDVKKQGKFIIGFTFTAVIHERFKPTKVNKIGKKSEVASNQKVDNLQHFADLRKRYGDNAPIPPEIEIELKKRGLW